MLYKIIGSFFVALAAIGAALPVMPTVPFLLVAVACFAKSSPRLHQKLLDNKVYGPMIRDWQENRSIPKRAKILALTSMFLGACWSLYLLELWYLKAIVITIMSLSALFILRLPTSESKVD